MFRRMERAVLTFILFYILTLQFSNQQIVFKPTKQTTGPFGRASGTRFDFDLGGDGFNILPARFVISHGSRGLYSISFVYFWQVGQNVQTGGRRAGARTEIDYPGRVIKAEVCTGRRFGVTVIIGLKFYYENGASNYFHGNTNLVSSFKCVDATPATPGYYLHYLSGRYGTYINQLRFHWVSNFEQEKACFEDPNCQQELNFCPGDYCCYYKELGPTGEWETSIACA